MDHRSVPNCLLGCCCSIQPAHLWPRWRSQQPAVGTWQSGRSEVNVNSPKRPIVQGSSEKKKKRWQNRKHRECLAMKINPKCFCCCDYRHDWPVEHWPTCLWLLSPSCDSSVSLLYLHDRWYISVLSNCSLPLSLLSHMGEDPPPPYQSGPVFFLLQGSFSLPVLGVKPWVSGKCLETVLTRTDVV